ncbi:MAG: transposase [Thaumarchaeota archaeon]|nr:transposase [Nitrososphaerota archaeon]
MYKTARRYRIYPAKKQEETLLRMVEVVRNLWNDALAHRRDAWENEVRSVTYFEQAKILTNERRVDSELGLLYSQSAQDILRRLDKAFKAFFSGVTRYPKFKPANAIISFTYPQAYNGSVKVNESTIRLSKVGEVPMVLHREVPTNGVLKTCTIIHEPNGDWYVSLIYDVSTTVSGPSNISSPVGVDLGLKSIIVTTDGVKIPHPSYLRKAERRLKRLQRSVSRKQRGSKNRAKIRRILAEHHAKIARQRKDFNHKLTTNLVRYHDAVFFEDLQVANMGRNHLLAKSIYDAGWGQILSFARYKEERVGGVFETVQSAYSTQECFSCGTLNPVTLDVREFDCAGCGRRLDRDLNAAWIVLKRGIAKVGQDMPELTPVEIRPPPSELNSGACPVVEAGTTRGGVHVQGTLPLEAHDTSCGRMSLTNSSVFAPDLFDGPMVHEPLQNPRDHLLVVTHGPPQRREGHRLGAATDGHANLGLPLCQLQAI